MTDSEGTDVASSDLFFSLAAILIVTLCLLSASIRESIATDRTKAALTEASTRNGTWLAIADADGVRLVQPAGEPLDLGLGEILSPNTEAWVHGSRPPVRVVLAVGAVDSAFLLDTALARAGVTEVERFRLSAHCGTAELRAEGLVCHDG